MKESDKYRIDSHKLHYHPHRVAQWLKADGWDEAKKVYPIYWEITTAANCSHRCHFCSVDSIAYPDIAIDPELLGDRMREAAALGVKSVMFAGTGEPLVHRQINDIVEYATSAGLDAAFTTNGVALNRLHTIDKCSWVKISLNAGTQATYAKVHGTKERDWTRVWRNIAEAVQRKGKCTLGVQCVVLPDNWREMHYLAKMAKEYGVDYLVLKPYSAGTFQAHDPIKTNYAEWDEFLSTVAPVHDSDTFKVIYRTDSMRQEMEGAHHYDRCRATPFFWTYTMADGRMFSCSAHLLDERFCVGNINTQSFQEIWEGEGRRKNWEMMRKFDISACRLNCRMDKQNRYLHEVGNGISHQNFI